MQHISGGEHGNDSGQPAGAVMRLFCKHVGMTGTEDEGHAARLRRRSNGGGGGLDLRQALGQCRDMVGGGVKIARGSGAHAGSSRNCS